MGNPVTTTGFTEGALEELISRGGDRPGALDARLRDAFALFEALPMPSPDTEEWRYTDLREMDLDLEPFVLHEPLPSLDVADEAIRAVATPQGERSGLMVQHDSCVVWTMLEDGLRAR